MVKLYIPAKPDDILKALKRFAKKACLKLVATKMWYQFPDEKVLVYHITFKKIPKCPKAGEKFSKTLQKILLGILKVKQKPQMYLICTPDKLKLGSGGNLSDPTSIHIDHRRLRKGIYPPGHFDWHVLHEIIHFYESWLLIGWIPGDKPDPDEHPSTIDLTNKVRKDLGEKCYRYPDHGIEVFICKNKDGSLTSVKVKENGIKKAEKKIDISKKNPKVPFTSGRLFPACKDEFKTGTSTD